MNVMRNRLANVGNRFQGEFKRVLCVCSAGLLRSPTAAVVLSGEPFNYNTRAAGCVPEYALVPVDEALLSWADEIVCMEQHHADVIEKMTEEFGIAAKIITLGIPDDFSYRDPELEEMIKHRYASKNNQS